MDALVVHAAAAIAAAALAATRSATLATAALAAAVPRADALALRLCHQAWSLSSIGGGGRAASPLPWLRGGTGAA